MCLKDDSVEVVEGLRLGVFPAVVLGVTQTRDSAGVIKDVTLGAPPAVPPSVTQGVACLRCNLTADSVGPI